MIEAKLTYKKRKKLKNSDFGIPELRSYPLNDKSHVKQAVRMFNHVDSKYEKELADNLNKAIKKFNLDIDVGDDNRFKKYFKEQKMSVKKYSKLTDDILSGVPVREALNINNESIKNFGSIKSFTLADLLDCVPIVDKINIQNSNGFLFDNKLVQLLDLDLEDKLMDPEGNEYKISQLFSSKVILVRPFRDVLIIGIDL